MPAEAPDAAIRSDVETLHHQSSTLLANARKRLEQIDDLHVREHVVAGRDVERRTEAELTRPHLPLELGAPTPSFRRCRAGRFELFCSELRNRHVNAFVALSSEPFTAIT